LLSIVFKNNYPAWTKVLTDFIILSVVFYVINFTIGLPSSSSSLLSSLVYSIISVFLLYALSAYSSMFRYLNIQDILRLFLAIFLSSSIVFLYSVFYDKTLFVNQLLCFFISFSVLVSYRVLIKILFSITNNKSSDSIQNIIVFGAGTSGIITKRAMYNSSEFSVKGFIDDNNKLTGKTIDGVSVFKLGAKLNSFIKANNIAKVIISTEKLSINRLNSIYNYFQNLNIQLLKLPSVKFWINGIPNISKLKEIKIEELLSRGTINIDNKKNKLAYNGKSILVSGAAGSIGSEIIRQLIKFKPAKIILLDNAETPMFNIKEELDLISNKINIQYNIDSICDEKALDKIFKYHKIDIVFHAAAYKHVNMMESNPRSAIINNVYGTKLMIDFSIKYNINKFVLISSDKAVNPTNVMGASKRICELYMASKINKHDTKFMSTRFGNVLGSNGSVVPIFEKQIFKGGPITITHPNIVRYFMTIPEASLLVLEAGTMGKGGEIFIFDMGDPVKIVDLAKNMVIQKGLKYGEDINIEFTGLRPGEKLFEELLLDTENLLKTYNDFIYIAKNESVSKESSNLISDLIKLAFNSSDKFKIVGIMKKIVPEYLSNHSEFQILDKNA
tara:strand:+ start:29676 stop:31520 length:1845 start_codon:yes stop_codon:yes gene_type:complete